MDELFLERAAALEQADRDEAVRAASAALLRPGQPYCDDCDEPIPDERRRAMPSATRCIGCQTISER